MGGFTRALLVSACLASAPAAAQPAPALSRQHRDLLQALITAVDRAAVAPAPADQVWLTHVLRASDGSHYVAFSVTPAVPLPAAPLLLYVRLATATNQDVIVAERSVVREWLQGLRTDPRLLPRRGGMAVGDMPPMGAGAAGTRGAASVGSADLQILELERVRTQQRRDDAEKQRRAELEGTGAGPNVRFPFEDFDLVSAGVSSDGARAVQRALTAGPGSYDLLVAWAEAAQPAAQAQVHVARRSLQLAPAAAEFGLSSIIVADAIGVRDAPYTPMEQRGHPYTIGVTEITPARDTVFTAQEQLSVAFQIVNPMPSPSGKPDVQISLRIVRADGARDQTVASLSPLTYNETTLPADLDVRLGHPVIAALSAPLATIPRGEYRLMIVAEDRVAGVTAGNGVAFRVAGTPASLLAEAPALGRRFEPGQIFQDPVLGVLAGQLAPAVPSPGLARSLQSARAGRLAELLVAEPGPSQEEGVRAALLGLALLSVGDLGAIAQFDRALQLQAPKAAVEFLLGAARALQSRDLEAIRAWQAARGAGWPHEIVDRLMADAYLRRREFPQAAAIIGEAAASEANGARTLAATRIAVRREAEAVATLDALLAREPGDLDARWLLVQALYSEVVHGNRSGRERFLAESQRYLDAKGPHSALAAEWVAVLGGSGRF